MSAVNVVQRQKMLKLPWIKRPKTVSRKKTFEAENKWLKAWCLSISFDLRISNKKAQKQQKLETISEYSFA